MSDSDPDRSLKANLESLNLPQRPQSSTRRNPLEYETSPLTGSNTSPLQSRRPQNYDSETDSSSRWPEDSREGSLEPSSVWESINESDGRYYLPRKEIRKRRPGKARILPSTPRKRRGTTPLRSPGSTRRQREPSVPVEDRFGKSPTTLTKQRIRDGTLKGGDVVLSGKEKVRVEVGRVRKEEKRATRQDGTEATAVDQMRGVTDHVLPIVMDVLGTATGIIGYVLSTFKDVIGTIFGLFRTPIIIILILYCFALVGITIFNRATEQVTKALEPLCKPPLTTWVELPFCDTIKKAHTRAEQPGIIDMEKLMGVQTKLGEVVETVGDTVGMARGMKGTEHAVRDLIAVVRSSSMERKADVSDLLEEFVNGAKSTSRDLARFSSKISNTIDNIITIDEYALSTLSSIQPPTVRTGLAKLLFLPLAPFVLPDTTEQQIQDALITVTTQMSHRIPGLILDAENLLTDLDSLENQLTLINEVVHRQRASIHTAETELLSSLWSRFWNSELLSPQLRESFRHHKDILTSVSKYRENALRLVTKTLVELQAIQMDLETFRERLVAPALGEKMPLQVQIDGIRRGVERLERGRMRMEGRREVDLVEGKKSEEEEVEERIREKIRARRSET
ncbi:hypothetical protein BJ508DRAFT_411596 [Ascobolus immersus RN42]|uniref:Uncharacterized protein n=1 Tax=Ascobolus immersus RN42 TaxID=1160509 RepID=A0A3N4IWJ3_ASCIM|nr:hypothetical protein BJ508DRAFT_411596 [Ascobolus immersus RN42]